MTEPPPDADPRPLLRRTTDQAVAGLAALGPDDLDRPTPCAGLDVRTLGGHLLSVLRRIVVAAGGGPALTVPVLTLGSVSVLASTAAGDRDRLVAAWADDDVLDRLLVLPFGAMSGREAAVAYGLELTAHAWDLAVAVGRADELDDEPAAALLPAAPEFVPAEPRGGHVPYGPVVPVDRGAGPYERLAGWLGRDPRWSPWTTG
jgi:uncharacterized protein (TIGR03086 family)